VLRSIIRANTKSGAHRLFAGGLFPLRRHFELDPYYEHQNITGKRPNQQLNQFGLILDFYYSQSKRQERSGDLFIA